MHFVFLIFSTLAWAYIYFYQLPPSILLNIPMRDGTILTADLYLPEDDAENHPCILVRSPAGRKNLFALMALTMLDDGYAIVIQDTRSVMDAEKKTIPYLADGWGEYQDGYDTVAYLAKSPYTNGKIGTLGASAMGITQLMMAPTNPPGLKTQYIAFATADIYHHGLYEGGELLKHQVETWLGYYSCHPTIYETICSQPEYNEFWSQFNMLPLAKKCHLPAMHVAGWYDTFLKGSLNSFVQLQYHGGEGAKGKQKLVVGPWIHLWPYISQLGEFEYPAKVSEPPYDFTPKAWFKSYLKKEGPEDQPAVTYYVMGPLDGSTSSGNVWKTSDVWPVPHETVALYLTEESLLQPITTFDHRFDYQYDPNDPVPTMGGRNLFLPSGPFDQRPVEHRPDVLIFTTEPLEEDLEITGEILAALFVETDQEDTAFAVRLTDVYPDGKSVLIADGLARLSYATKNIDTKQTPSQLEVDLWSTSMVFAKGHRLRVIVTSSNYPRFEKNFNSKKRAHEGPEPQIANNAIYVGPTYPSHIALPVVSKRDLR